MKREHQRNIYTKDEPKTNLIQNTGKMVAIMKFPPTEMTGKYESEETSSKWKYR